MDANKNFSWMDGTPWDYENWAPSSMPLCQSILYHLSYDLGLLGSQTCIFEGEGLGEDIVGGSCA